jgi:hypothetical protein
MASWPTHTAKLILAPVGLDSSRIVIHQPLCILPSVVIRYIVFIDSHPTAVPSSDVGAILRDKLVDRASAPPMDRAIRDKRLSMPKQGNREREVKDGVNV